MSGCQTEKKKNRLYAYHCIAGNGVGNLTVGVVRQKSSNGYPATAQPGAYAKGYRRGVLLTGLGVRGRGPGKFFETGDQKDPILTYFDHLVSVFQTINSRLAGWIVECEVACPRASRAACLPYALLFWWCQTRKRRKSMNSPRTSSVPGSTTRITTAMICSWFEQLAASSAQSEKFPSS